MASAEGAADSHNAVHVASLTVMGMPFTAPALPGGGSAMWPGAKPPGGGRHIIGMPPGPRGPAAKPGSRQGAAPALTIGPSPAWGGRMPGGNR